MRLKLNFYLTTGTAGWDNVKLTSTGVINASLTDFTTGLPSSVALSHAGTVWTAAASGALTNAMWYGIEEGVWDNSNTTALANTSTTTISGAGLVAGRAYQITFAGATNQDRDVTITANDVSTLYNNTVQSTPITPAIPVVLQAVAVDDGLGGGKIDFAFAGTSISKHITFLIITDEIGSINSIGADNAVKIGQSVSQSVSYFTPTSGTIGGVDLTAVSASSITIPDYIDGGYAPDYGVSSVVETDGTSSPNLNVTVYPSDDYLYTRIRDISSTDPHNLNNYIAVSLDDTFTFQRASVLEVALNTVTFDGFFRTDYRGIQTIFHHSKLTNLVTALEIDTSAGTPVIDGNGLTSVGLTSAGLTSRGLTSAGL